MTGIRPQIVAHRGASHDSAEHTLRAYRRALEAGADALECDVRLTADGHLVCVHDRTLRRTGLSRESISTLALDELGAVEVATWKNPWFDMDDEAEDLDLELDGVLPFRRLCELVREQPYRVELAVETKHPTRYSGLVERRLVETLAEFGWAGADSPVRMMSFSLTAVQRTRRLAPNLPVVMLVDKAHHWPALRRLVRPDWIIGPGIDELTAHPGFGRHLAGRQVHVWTVNTRAQLQTCLDLGVRAVITDRPDHIRTLLDESRPH